MDQKAWLYALAASGLVAGAVKRAQGADVPTQKETASVDCFGINSCKQKNSCGVSQNQLELAKTVYKERFKSAKIGECGGSAEGPASKGFLAPVTKDKKSDCFKAGGFVYIKDKSDNLQIEDKSGVKTAEAKK